MSARTDRESAWAAGHDALPGGWTVGPPAYDPGRAWLAYLQGTEEWSMETTGRGRAKEELVGVVRRFR